MLRPFLLTASLFAVGSVAANTPNNTKLPLKGSPELLGYLENWVDVKWWDNNMPGNCYQGCFEAAPLITKTTPYSSVNYGFTFLTQNPDPDQLDCSGSHGGKKDEGCPVWDGQALYLSKSSKPFSHSVDSTTTLNKPTPSIVAISEVVRMMRMHPSGPKRAKITLGGWSDYARIGTPENGKAIAKLAAKLVAYSFADGLDIDMEHLTPFSNTSRFGPQADEFAAFASFVNQLRVEFDALEAGTTWADNALSRAAGMLKEYNAYQPWQQKEVAPYYLTNMAYLKEVAKNPPPHLEISWTTRFNAWVPKNDTWNYANKGTQHPNVSYPTDNEGMKLWPQTKDAIDTINVMAYDAGILSINFTQVLINFKTLSGDPDIALKVNMGFEPGEQFAGGHWEGKAADEAVTNLVKNTYDTNPLAGGIMIWAVNSNPKQAPTGSKLCPEIAEMAAGILKPQYAYGPAPNYTKCDPSTGYNPNAPKPGPPPGPHPGPSPPGPNPSPSPSGSCSVKAYQQCGGTHGCCAGKCTCVGTTYKQCTPASGSWQC